jgi:hypothetical protein
MTKISGSGSASGSESISQRHGSTDPDTDPDPQQNVMDPEHWSKQDYKATPLCFALFAVV